MAGETLKDLRRRVRSVNNIRKITRAMEMVASAKLRRAQGNLNAARPYAGKLSQVLARLAEDPSLNRHPLFQPRQGARRILVLFTSDRGLCGSFNANIINYAEDIMEAEPDAQWQLVCVGRKGRDYFQRRSVEILDSYIGQSDQADLETAWTIADRLVERYLAGQCDSIALVYMRFISTVVYRPTLDRYLGLSREAVADDAVPHAAAPDARETRELEYIFEPSRQAVLESLLPRYLRSRIFITMAEAAASEHSARMVAMNNATSNCSDLADDLTLKMNRARQDTITKELLDIVGGAEALR